jgi:hypothetical protein
LRDVRRVREVGLLLLAAARLRAFFFAAFLARDRGAAAVDRDDLTATRTGSMVKEMSGAESECLADF